MPLGIAALPATGGENPVKAWAATTGLSKLVLERHGLVAARLSVVLVAVQHAVRYACRTVGCALLLESVNLARVCFEVTHLIPEHNTCEECKDNAFKGHNAYEHSRQWICNAAASATKRKKRRAEGESEGRTNAMRQGTPSSRNRCRCRHVIRRARGHRDSTD